MLRPDIRLLKFGNLGRFSKNIHHFLILPYVKCKTKWHLKEMYTWNSMLWRYAENHRRHTYVFQYVIENSGKYKHIII
jgi:hypothetical protein